MDTKGILDAELQEEISIYARISVDLEDEEDDNTSIENQLKIIKNEIKRKFPKCTFKEYIDRDRSGYTFEQREGYQEMRKALLSGQSRILMIKDFSRFARRAGAGLVELEFLRDTGIRIISVMEAIDYPKQDDWLGIQVRFLMNEQPVTGTSKSVKRSIATMQQEGEWLCSVPYGYIVTTVRNKQKVEVVLDEAVVIREIFRLYAYEGWGYKKIASYLTDKNIPTPRMKSNQRLEEAGREVKQKSSKFWSVVTISSLLENDFYIGTYRGHKYTRTKINGADVKVDESEHIIIEKHHEAIIDDKVFLYTQEQLKLRTASATHYRGQKKYDTPYTGYLFCGDCGSPMFSRSRPDLEPSYICGNYHKNGLKACSSHHTRFDLLDGILKDYVQLVKNNCQGMISELEKTIATEADNVKENDKVIKLLEGQLASAKEELKACKKQKIRELAKADDPELIEETFTEIEQEITDRIHGLQEQLKTSIDKRSQVVEIARMAKTVFDVFDDILSKQRLDKVDISLVVDKIVVFNSGLIEVNLKPDIMALLETGTLPNEVEVDPVNFNFGSIDSLFNALYTYKIPRRREQVYTANVVREGDPSITTLSETEKRYIFSMNFLALGTRLGLKSSDGE